LIHFYKRYIKMTQQLAHLTQELLRNLDLNEEDLKKMVADAVFYLLIADQKKGIIRKNEIVNACDLKKRDRKLQDHVLRLASNDLSLKFGIELKELENKSTFILINKLREVGSKNQFLNWSDKESAQMGITFIILGLILMSNEKIAEDTLLDFLRNLGLHEDEKNVRNGTATAIDAEILALFDGDVKRFVNEVLVNKQHYLKKVRVKDDEVERYEYIWGDRSEAEVKKSTVFRMVCSVYDCEPKMFTEQYEKIKELEGLTDEEFANATV